MDYQPELIVMAISKVAYWRALPEHLRALHLDFYIWLLEAQVEDTIEGQQQTPPPAVNVEGADK